MKATPERTESSSLSLRALCVLCVRFSAVVVLLAVLILAARAGNKKLDVSRIHGRIQYVNSFPDYKVQAVTSFPDLKVQIVTSFPDKPGQWQIVDSFPDYKIEMVNSFPDFTIEYVTSFPGPK
jgi:uncharacterized protein YlzI (FlbEa/FlbD family)